MKWTGWSSLWAIIIFLSLHNGASIKTVVWSLMLIASILLGKNNE